MDDRRYEELNGCYAMLCEALRAWHRMQKDHPRETAAKVLKCFASMFVRQVRQCFSAVWADGFPRCRHRFPVM